MKVEQTKYGQILYLEEGDIVDDDTYTHLKLVGIGCFANVYVPMFRTIVSEPELLVDGKHVIFFVQETANRLTSTSLKVLLDHEFGHIADGQLDTPEMQNMSGEGGAVVKPEWEYAADDFSVKLNGQKTVYEALKNSVHIFANNPIYIENGYDLTKDPTIVSRLKRLEPEAEAA